VATLRRPPLRVWVWTAATLVLVVVATLLWRGSDAAATSRSTASPAADPTGSPAGELSPAWSRTASLLPEQVVAADRVIVGDRHGITALDPATGEQAWHYTRSNAVLCGLTATEGVAVAVFRTEVRCDEAVALHADTGVYAWTRSLDLDSDVRLTSTGNTVLAIGSGSVVVIDPIGDNIRWRTEPEGCTVVDAATGTSGVAVLLRCEGTDALRLQLLDGSRGSALWTRDVPADDDIHLAGADYGVSLVVGDELQRLATADGAPTETVALPPADESDADPVSTVAGPVLLVWAHGTLVARAAGIDALAWEQPALGLPTSSGPLKVDGLTEPLLVPEDGAFVARDPATGDEVSRSTVADLPAGGISTPVGDVVVYRLPDRVIAYR